MINQQQTIDIINEDIAQQIEYCETHEDYSSQYLDLLGDTLQYDGIYSEDEIYSILDSELTTSTDYSYACDDSVAAYSLGEIEIQIDTDLTKEEFEEIEDEISDVCHWYQGHLLVYVCSGINVRVYSDFKKEVTI